MAKSVLVLVVFLLATIAVQAQGPAKVKKTNKKMEMPYEAEYSSQFKIGEDRLSLKVLELWKDFEENDIDRHLDYFSEDLTLDLADGTRFIGLQKILEETKSFRGSLSDYESVIEAYISLQSIDKDEDWVAVWGKDTFTNGMGAKEVNALHELWKFDKDGKVEYIRQYMSKPAAEAKADLDEDDEW